MSMSLWHLFVVCVAFAGMSLVAFGEMATAGLATKVRNTCAGDFQPERADGRTTKTMAWARKKCADAAKPPAHPFLKDRESFLAWKKDYLKKYASYLPWKPKEPAVEFVSKEKRDGFTLCDYECHPYPRAADDMPWWASRGKLSEIMRQLGSCTTELVTRAS